MATVGLPDDRTRRIDFSGGGRSDHQVSGEEFSARKADWAITGAFLRKGRFLEKAVQKETQDSPSMRRTDS